MIESAKLAVACLLPAPFRITTKGIGEKAQTMLPDELTAFLDLYAHPAAIIVRGAVQFQNTPFRLLRECSNELLLGPLRTAVAASSARVVTQFPAAGRTSGATVWSLTHQYGQEVGSERELWRTVVLAQDSTVGGDEEVACAIPSRPLGGDRWWLSDPRFKGIRTGGGELGDMIRSWDWVRLLAAHITFCC